MANSKPQNCNSSKPQGPSKPAVPSKPAGNAQVDKRVVNTLIKYFENKGS